jgi:predicted permease
MTFWRKLAHLIPSVRRASERDMQDEIESLREMAAPGALGNLTLAVEDARSELTWISLERLGQDLRYAVRILVKSFSFTALCVLTLALGIVATSTIFSWIDGTLLNPIPGAQRTREIVSLTRGDLSDSPTPPYSYPDLLDLKRQNTSFVGLLGYHNQPMGLTGSGRPVRVWVTYVTADYFRILGVVPAMGRFFSGDEDAAPGSGAVTVLNDAVWQSQFGGDPSIIGRTIHINRHPVTIIGVAPKQFQGAMPAVRSDLWLPLTMDYVIAGDRRILDRGTSWLNVLGRLAPGVTRVTAQQEINALVQQLVEQYPNDHRGPNQVVLDPMWRSPFGGNVYFAALLPVLLGMAVLVLLLACANVANLLLVRAIGRRKEIAIRLAVGCTRGRLIRQFFIEAILIAVAGGMVASLLTRWTSGLLAHFVPSTRDVAIGINTTLDGFVVAATFIVALFSTVVFGIVPALRAAHVDPITTIKEEAGRMAGGVGRSRIAWALVVTQVSLSLLLLVSAGLFVRSLQNAQRLNPGFDPHNVMTAAFDLWPAGYSSSTGTVLQKELLRKVAALPGVEAVTMTDWLPLGFTRRTANVNVDGYVPQEHESMEIRIANVGPAYLRTLRNPILAGRDIAATDVPGSQPVAIVNRAFADRYWRGEDPIGKRIEVRSRWRTVIGIAETARYRRLDEPPEPFVFIPILQDYDSDVVLLVRSSVDRAALMPMVEQAVHELDPELPVFDVSTMDSQVRVSSTFQRIAGSFIGSFGLISLLLAAVGLYAVVAYTTRQRTHEIGIRMALGARPERLFTQVVSQGLRMTGIGLLIGLTLSAVLTRFLRGQLLGVTPVDLPTYAAVALLLVVIAAVACLVPAVRAARVEPVVALHHE